MADATYHGTAADLRAAFRGLVRAAAGQAADPLGLARGLQLRLGVALLAQVQTDFVTKSRGGIGRDGITWPALKPQTIAQRRTTGAEKRSLGISGKRTRGLLTPAQDKRWRGIYASTLARLLLQGVSGGAAQARAAQLAWAQLKAQGAQTKLAVLGSRQVDMCRDTGAYFQSLTPGVEDQPSGAEGQVFETPPGRVIVGSQVAYAAAQHARRPLWPANGQLPDSWWQALRDALARGLLQAARFLAGRGP